MNAGVLALSSLPLLVVAVIPIACALWRHAFEPAETGVIAHVCERSADLARLTAFLTAAEAPLRANASPPLAPGSRATASLCSIPEFAFLARFAAPGEGVDAAQTGQ
jgi:hypothetical protein